MSTFNQETLRTIVKSLAEKRPRFCSEADFQFALGWKIQEEFPQAEVRFECPATLPEESKAHIDIVVNLDGKLFPIELKWKLERHKADPINRGMMLHDIDRLEALQMNELDFQDMNFTKTPKEIRNRFAIWLSDNHRFWDETGKNGIHEYGKYAKISWEFYAGEFKFALIGVAK
jgi:hypothetical protein